MKIISQSLIICIFALSNTITQASSGINNLPQLTRNQVVPTAPKRLFTTPTSPVQSVSTSSTPITVGSSTSGSTPSSPEPMLSPRLVKHQDVVAPTYTQEHVDRLIASRLRLAREQFENEKQGQCAQIEQLKGLLADNKKRLSFTLVEHKRHMFILGNQMRIATETVDKQDVELVELSNELILLKLQKNQQITSDVAANQNNSIK